VLFFPMLLLLGLSLHVSGIQAMLPAGYRDRIREAALLGLHLVAYLKALVFIVLHQGLFGLYLGLSFAPTTRACRSSATTTRATSCAGR
jgi:hypothetical protein